MPINKNHEFEDLDGIKCAIVEKNASRERVDFLKQILTYNHYTVVVVASPPPKPIPATTAPVPLSDNSSESEIGNAIPELPPQPQTYTIGVTDVTFNPINAIFGRLLTSKTGHTITLAYWHQEENIPHDDVPYFDKEN